MIKHWFLEAEKVQHYLKHSRKFHGPTHPYSLNKLIDTSAGFAKKMLSYCQFHWKSTPTFWTIKPKPAHISARQYSYESNENLLHFLLMFLPLYLTEWEALGRNEIIYLTVYWFCCAYENVQTYVSVGNLQHQLWEIECYLIYFYFCYSEMWQTFSYRYKPSLVLMQFVLFRKKIAKHVNFIVLLYQISIVTSFQSLYVL